MRTAPSRSRLLILCLPMLVLTPDRRRRGPMRSTFLGQAMPPEQPLALWYQRPAGEWLEALPLGNGRLGAMVYGGVPDRADRAQ